MCEQFKDSTVGILNATEKSDDDEKCREDIVIYCPKGYVCRQQAFGNFWCFNATIARRFFYYAVSLRHCLASASAGFSCVKLDFIKKGF